ncbi:hypothetical protein [Micromonospora yangpuensis]|uniref:Uncharacterized protein n=1 Tax=Micromonospora yangpuensis TaxID=683228 RepID=A0A1C6TYI7_9ACTN|nr:hypothetical protein [Micromonospora yangpuensis]GGM20465.1 hypothetical protein GCM10012279_43550 [Micromonospora yangpuensis]SCL46844.1 hypothetical protein GA0070617_0404 [Micromonospora yangpuensis]
MGSRLRNLVRRSLLAPEVDGEAPPGQEPSVRDTQSLETLLLDYEMVREDERNYLNVQAGLYGVAIALIALMIGALTQECGLGMREPPDCTDAPDAVLAAAPILPLGLIAFIQGMGSIASIRSYYLRGLERELGRYVPQPIAALGDLRPISYVGLTTELISLRRGFLTYRILFNTILLAIFVVFGGMTFYIGTAVTRPYQVAMAVLYGTVVLILLTQTLQATVGGARLFALVARRFVQGPRYSHLPKVHAATEGGVATTFGATRQRSFLSYLLLPRPEDMIKWSIAPLTYAAFAVGPGGWADVRGFVVLWLVLEYLVYMARYQWNDVRGVTDDWEHSESAARGRLPIGRDFAETRSNILGSVFVAALRLVLAMLVAWLAGLVAQTGWTIAVVFGVAVLYEVFRSPALARVPGTVPVVWLLVGAGYAIRGAVGIQGAGVPLRSGPALVGLGFFVSFGIMFVLLTWVLDATSYGRTGPDGSWAFRPALRRKPHLARLLSHTSLRRHLVTGQRDEEPEGEYGGDVRLLRDDPQRPRPGAPWNVAQVVAAGLGAVLGLELAVPADRLPAAHLTVLAGGVALALLVQQIRKTWVNVLTVVAGVGAPVAVALVAGAAYPVLAPLPWLVVALTYVSFRGSSYQELKSFGPMVVGHLRRLPRLLMRGIVGSATWDRLVR